MLFRFTPSGVRTGLLARMLVLILILIGFALIALPRAQANPAPIRVGYIPVLGSSQLFVLDGEGWAKEAGLDLQLIRFQAGPQAIQALAARKIDVYIAGVLPLLVARAHGSDVKVVAAGAMEELEVIANGKLAEGLPKDALTPQGASLKDRFAAFTKATGRKPQIATQPTGSVPDTLLRYWLKQNDIAATDVDILGIGIDAAQQAFLTGALDAAVLREPALTLVEERLPDARLLATGHQIMPEQPGSVLAIESPNAADRLVWRDKLVKLFIRATDLINAKPQEASPFILKVLGGGILTEKTIAAALASPGSRFISDPSLIMKSVSDLQDFEVASGTLRKAEPVADLFDIETYARAKK